MLKTTIYDNQNKPIKTEKDAVVDFLFENLEQYGDPKEQIERAFDYSVQEIDSFGGFSMTLTENEEILAATIVNKTGMGGYIPENILVYIATSKHHRGKGLGKKLMQSIIDASKGDIALHVEANNPAKFLYEKMGFSNPYLEMRLKRK